MEHRAPQPGRQGLSERLSERVDAAGRLFEAVLYATGGLLLALVAVAILADLVLFELRPQASTERLLGSVDRLLLVFVLAELIYTVRLAFARHTIDPEPLLAALMVSLVRQALLTDAGAALTGSAETLLKLAVVVALVLAVAAMLAWLRGRRTQG